jgi:ADP-dependent NAD(P)H-hydrate dehydratase / NAD(P)H-hydrate epimerase
MHPRPRAHWNPAQVRAIDSFTINELSIPGYELMRRAAQAALNALRRRWPAARHIGVICGGGNNAGDGYVLARLARAAGLAVETAALVDPVRLSGDAHRAHADWVQSGGTSIAWRELLGKRPDVLVDALLGTGATRGLTGEFAEMATAVNASRGAVMALDLPSGLDARTGQILGAKRCVRADLTVTFIADKPGLWLGAGPDQVGELVVDDLDLVRWPDDLGPPAIDEWPMAEFARALAARARGANKGRYGHVLVIGGHTGMPGAVLLSATAALRSGAGLVSVATAHEHAAVLAAARPELMIHGVESASEAQSLIDRADVIAIGPGLGRDAWSQGLWSAALAASKPLVVDADALNLLAQTPQHRDDWILTPHPGEAGRLLGSDAASVQADRLGAAGQLQQRFGGTVVLKGAGSLVAAPGGAVALCNRGNPGMAAPGMGDTLTGIAAALVGQTGDQSIAARTAVMVHAMAGDRAAEKGERGMIASDLIECLRACLNPH